MVLFNGDFNTERAAYQSHHAAKQCNKLERLIAADQARCENAMRRLQARIDENHRKAGEARAATRKADDEMTDAVASLPAARAGVAACILDLAAARADHAEARAALDRSVGDRREAERERLEMPQLVNEARALAARNEADAAGAEAAFHRLAAALEMAAPDHPLVRDTNGAVATLGSIGMAAYDRVASRHGLPTKRPRRPETDPKATAP